MDDETKQLLRLLLAKLGSEQQAALPAVPLRQALDEVIAQGEMGQVTRQQYERALRRFNEFLGRPAVSSDLTHENMNRWLSWLATVKGQSPCSRLNHRSGINRIWNHLALDGLVQPYNIRRMPLKVKQKQVRAWDDRQVSALLKAAGELEGTLRIGIPASRFMLAWLHVGYDTGLRPCDLRRLVWSSVNFEQRRMTIIQQKTGNPHSCALSLDSINALRRIVEPTRERVFPLCKWGVRRWEGMLYDLASDYGFVKEKFQGIGTLRKTHATQIYKLHGLNAAAESLGHVSGSGIAKRHYVDSREQHLGQLPPRIAE